MVEAGGVGGVGAAVKRRIWMNVDAKPAPTGSKASKVGDVAVNIGDVRAGELVTMDAEGDVRGADGRLLRVAAAKEGAQRSPVMQVSAERYRAFDKFFKANAEILGLDTALARGDVVRKR